MPHRVPESTTSRALQSAERAAAAAMAIGPRTRHARRITQAIIDALIDLPAIIPRRPNMACDRVVAKG